MRRISATTAAITLAATLLGTALLLSTAGAEDAAKPAAAEAPEPYRPGLADFMAHQQERHIKLWFAGRAGNWPLADYQVDALKDGFEDVTGLLGGDIVEKHVGPAIAALEKAIDDKNRAAFVAAYDKLSAGCNACHKTLDHAFIVIGRPASLPYSDQVFEPQK
jgi:hypothetical protein